MPKGKAGSDRLTRDDWVSAGIEALEETGFLSVRADALARRLGVSRGSFYWHFADVAAFEQALVERWRDMVLAALDTPPAVDETPLERFRTIMWRSLRTQRSLEAAFRAWGAVNTHIQVALRRVDANREAYMARLIARPDRTQPATLARARIAYWSYLGRTAGAELTEAEIEAIVEALVELVGP